ncbi:MAG TPA: hypothetical protein VIU29_04165 [Candidatus Deferrimicrobiaceae bacterium]
MDETKNYHFAIDGSQPFAAFLETYGVEDGETYYVWIRKGEMQGLCQGLAGARAVAAERGWKTFSFDSPEEALAHARERASSSGPFEVNALYEIALTLAGTLTGEGSPLFRGISREFAGFCRAAGNERLASYLEELAERAPVAVGHA